MLVAFLNSPYRERLAILDLKTLESRRIINDLILFDKIHKNKIQLNESNKAPTLDTITRGNKSNYTYRHARTNLRKDSFFIRIPKIYKKLQAKLPLNYFTSEQLKQSLNTFDVVEFANETIHS